MTAATARASRALALAAALAAAAGCGVRRRPSSPAPGRATGDAGAAEAFWRDWRRAVAARDGQALWDMTCASNKKSFVEHTRGALAATGDPEWERLAKLTEKPAAELKTLSAEALAEAVTVATLSRLQDQPAELEKAEKSELAGVELDGDRARVKFLVAGKEMSLALVKENGAWKADFEASAKSGGAR